MRNTMPTNIQSQRENYQKVCQELESLTEENNEETNYGISKQVDIESKTVTYSYYSNGKLLKEVKVPYIAKPNTFVDDKKECQETCEAGTKISLKEYEHVYQLDGKVLIDGENAYIIDYPFREKRLANIATSQKVYDYFKNMGEQ
jgi:hypothetical protein